MNDKQNDQALQTVLVIVIALLVFFVISQQLVLVYIAIGLGIVALLSSYLASKIHWLWMKFSYLLSLVVPNILLSLVFFIVLTPIAWLSKLFGDKNPLQLKNTNHSLFKNTKKSYSPSDFEKPW